MVLINIDTVCELNILLCGLAEWGREWMGLTENA